nr:zinc finger, CCHC-type [Tanacetum cinerariifolium]
MVVQISVACCICDIMRIMAPDTPYDDNQMKTVNPESEKKTLAIVETPSKSVTMVNGKRKRHPNPLYNLVAAAGKEAEWLKNFLLEIPLWSKPIAPIYIHCDSAAKLKKAYSQMYNEKSRHLGVRHSMICKLITNGVIYIVFVGYDKHSKAFRFYVIEPNESILINSIIESRDAIFDENRFFSVPRPSLSIPKGTKDIGGSMVPKEATEEYEVSNQHSYCFNVEDNPKTFDEAMKSQDVAFLKEAINDEMHSIMGNNTAFLNGDLDEEVDLTKEFLSSKFSMKDIGEADVVLGIRIEHKMAKWSRYTSNPETRHWQTIQRVLEYLKKTIDYKLTYTCYPLVLEGYTDARWISNTEDNLSTSGWIFLLGGAAGKEAIWLKNLLLEIPLWSKPIAPISICCDSAATLAKAYSQMYSEKSRHLGVRHSMIRELITDG